MTPQEARAEFRAIETDIGTKADIYVSLNRKLDGGPNFKAHVYIDGITGKAGQFNAQADDLAGLVAATKDAWAGRQERHAAEQVRKMALAIIRLTYDQGECTDAAIRADGFTDQDLRRYGGEAVERANEMADRGPFAIKRLRGSNGMPDEVAA